MVLFVAAASWHSPQFTDPAGCGPLAAAVRCTPWLPVAGLAVWQIPQFGSAIAVPHVELATAVPVPVW
jgi:hypothetical protein